MDNYSWSETTKRFLNIDNKLIVDVYEIVSISKKSPTGNDFVIKIVLADKEEPEMVFFQNMKDRNATFDSIWKAIGN